jgi:hypothetical protein
MPWRWVRRMLCYACTGTMFEIRGRALRKIERLSIRALRAKGVGTRIAMNCAHCRNWFFALPNGPDVTWVRTWSHSDQLRVDQTRKELEEATAGVAEEARKLGFYDDFVRMGIIPPNDRADEANSVVPSSKPRRRHPDG